MASNNACEASKQLKVGVLANGGDKSELVISIVACCHSVKLCSLAARRVARNFDRGQTISKSQH